MFRSLAINIGISAVAFVVTSLISLGLIPLVIGTYGLVYYGLITLARIFLPSATFAIFDFGYSEIATQVISRARVDGKWESATRQLIGVVVIASMVALVVGVLLAFAVPFLMKAFRTPAGAVPGFELLLFVTSATFVPLLIGLVADGIVKGFESFRGLRAAEISSTCVYAAAVLVCIYADLGFAWVGIAYCVSLLFRLIALAVIVKRKFPRVALNSLWPEPDEWAYVLRRCRVMAPNKWLGISQAQLAPLLIGLMLGPSSAAIFDVMTRFPRFAKLVLGVLNVAVLPVAGRLEFAGQSMRRLGEVGLFVAAAASIPICVAGITFSAPLLSQWIGPNYAAYAGWQALMFVVPILNAIIGFPGTALLVRPDVTAKMNRIVLLQIIIQYSISIGAASYLAEGAFILGQVVAVIATFFPQAFILTREGDISAAAFLRLLPIVAVSAALCGLCFVLGLPWRIANVAQLLAALAGWIILHYALLWVLVLNDAGRIRIVKMLFSRSEQNPSPQ